MTHYKMLSNTNYFGDYVLTSEYSYSKVLQVDY